MPTFKEQAPKMWQKVVVDNKKLTGEYVGSTWSVTASGVIYWIRTSDMYDHCFTGGHTWSPVAEEG